MSIKNAKSDNQRSDRKQYLVFIQYYISMSSNEDFEKKYYKSLLPITVITKEG